MKRRRWRWGLGGLFGGGNEGSGMFRRKVGVCEWKVGVGAMNLWVLRRDAKRDSVFLRRR